MSVDHLETFETIESQVGGWPDDGRLHAAETLIQGLTRHYPSPRGARKWAPRQLPEISDRSRCWTILTFGAKHARSSLGEAAVNERAHG